MFYTYIKTFIVVSLIVYKSQAQQIDLSIRAGAAKQIGAPASSTRGYIFRSVHGGSPYPTLHAEAAKKKYGKIQMPMQASALSPRLALLG